VFGHLGGDEVEEFVDGGGALFAGGVVAAQEDRCRLLVDEAVAGSAVVVT
jgi:hypothetical protein